MYNYMHTKFYCKYRICSQYYLVLINICSATCICIYVCMDAEWNLLVTCEENMMHIKVRFLPEHLI